MFDTIATRIAALRATVARLFAPDPDEETDDLEARFQSGPVAFPLGRDGRCQAAEYVDDAGAVTCSGHQAAVLIGTGNPHPDDLAGCVYHAAQLAAGYPAGTVHAHAYHRDRAASAVLRLADELRAGNLTPVDAFCRAVDLMHGHAVTSRDQGDAR